MKASNHQHAYRHDLMIGIGEKSHFYTLREAYPHYGPGAVINGVFSGSIEIRYGHRQNLSQNPEAAIAKAQDIAKALGLPLRATSAAELSGQLEEIKRADAAEIERRVLVEQQRQAEYEERRRVWDAQLLEVLAAGFMPIGKFMGEAIEDIDRGYATWLMDKREEMEPGTLMRAIADKVSAEYADLKLPVPDKDKTVGEVKQRLEFDAIIIRMAHFETEWGLVAVITMVTEEGACLVAKGNWRAIQPGRYHGGYVDAKIGERVKIKATVKKHDRYNDQMQTVINRVKEV